MELLAKDCRKLTAYCGLYCGDCILSNQRFFELIDELDVLLQEIKFSNYAEFKSKRSNVFHKYPDFISVLREIKKLKCNPQCYEGPCSKLGCGSDCTIRKCVIDKGYEGCWECKSYMTCDDLVKHKDFHPGLEQNLDMIKKYGINNWVNKRGKHYNW